MNVISERIAEMPKGSAPLPFSDFFDGYSFRHTEDIAPIGLNESSCQIGPGISFSAPDGFDYGRTTPRPWLVDYIKKNMLQLPHDHIGFKVTIRSDGSALLSVRYGSILGGRWVGFIDPDTIPDAVNLND